MELLELPPEIFAKVIHCYVIVAGISEAWKHREVCKTFATYIKRDIIADQPVTSFTKQGAGAKFLLEHCLYYEYILVRLNRRHTPQDIVPAFVKDMVSRLIQLDPSTGIVDPKLQEQRFTRTLINFLLCQDRKLAFNAGTLQMSTSTFRRAQQAYWFRGPECMMAASVAMGDIDLLKATFANWGDDLNPEDIFMDIEPFGQPVVTAATFGDLEILRAIVKWWVDGTQREVHSVPRLYTDSVTLRKAIEIAMKSWRCECAKFLLHVLARYGSDGLGQQAYRKWMQRAVKSGYLGLLEAIILIKPQTWAIALYIEGFILACKEGLEHLAMVFVWRNLVHVDQEFIRTAPPYSNIPYEPGVFYWDSPLSLAARFNMKWLVRTCLAKGADPNGTRSQKRMPLYESMLEERYEIVRILLEHGAWEISVGTNPERQWTKRDPTRTVHQAKHKLRADRPAHDYGDPFTYEELFGGAEKLFVPQAETAQDSPV